MGNTERNHRFLLVALVLVLCGSVASFGQTWSSAGTVRTGATGTLRGTVTTIDPQLRSFEVRFDDSQSVIRVTPDVVATTFFGFGTGGAEDRMRGGDGMKQLRAGDRVEVRGVGGSGPSVAATEVRLLGRTTSSSSTTATSVEGSRIEGVVRSIRTRDSEFVIETSDRKMYTVRGTSNTPVYFRGQTFRISNIEVGDTVRVEIDRRDGGDIRARFVDVISDATPDDVRPSDNRTITSLFGRITRIDDRTRSLRMTDDRGREVRVDAANARDVNGDRLRITDFQTGDQVEVSGRWSGDVFIADTVRMGRLGGTRDDDRDVFSDEPRDRVETVVIYGEVEEGLVSGGTLLRVKNDDVRSRREDEVVQIMVDPDFVVRTRTGDYIVADQLKKEDRVVVKAFRDRDGNLIAQTIRMR